MIDLGNAGDDFKRELGAEAFSALHFSRLVAWGGQIV